MADTLVTEREKLNLEREKLELEVLRSQVRKLRETSDRQAIAHAQVEEGLADYNNKQKQRQDACNHMKGGVDLQGLSGRGDAASDYAIILHQHALGDIHAICQRCIKQWTPKDPGYQEIVNKPSKNTMSAGVIFRVSQNAR